VQHKKQREVSAPKHHITKHLVLPVWFNQAPLDPEDGWTAEAQRQYELARTACCTLARLYISAGFNCVIDDVISGLKQIHGSDFEVVRMTGVVVPP